MVWQIGSTNTFSTMSWFSSNDAIAKRSFTPRSWTVDTRQSLRGELVSQDPTDEPASVLLERIRKGREAEPAGKTPLKVAKSKR